MDATDSEPVLYGARELVIAFDSASRAGVTRHLVSHMPAGMSPSDVRDSFISHIGGRRAACWQDIWDEWVQHGGGRVQVTMWRCEGCGGQRVDRRTGRVCTKCAGRGSYRHSVWVPARAAPRPPDTV